MTISEFYRKFPDDQSCRDHLRQSRESSGISCKKCCCQTHYWLKAKEQWQCKKCTFRTTLRSGTMFESSKLAIKLWYEALYLVCNTKKGISACELQRQLGLKRNEPAWYMLHKIRKTMARINEHDQLSGAIGLDDAFFTTVDQKSAIPPKGNNTRGSGTCKQKAFVMIKSAVQSGKGKLRMLAVENIEQETIWSLGNQNTKRFDKISTATYRNYKILDPHKHELTLVESFKTHFLFPWVQTAIGNIKRLINGIYHHISTRFSQLYFDEFSFKFNYRCHKSKWNVVLSHSLKADW
jgi:hypothetical protein